MIPAVATRVFLAAATVVAFALPAASARAACDAPIPDTMRVVRQHGYGGPEQLRVDTIATPRAERGEVLVRVAAASVNPIDWKIRQGLWAREKTLASPIVPGRDAAGVVVAVGTGVGGIACGDAVVAYLDDARSGGYAQYVPVPAKDVAPLPKGMSFVDGAAYPLTSLTAWNALVDVAKVRAGERVLVHGGAGGVGSMGVQIAKARDATVIATASARNHDFLRAIGADEVIDYTAVKFEDVVRDVDVVFDTVGGDTLARSVGVVRRGGRLVSVAGRVPRDACGARGITCAQGNANNIDDALRQVGDLFAAGRMRVHVDATFPLAEAGAAQERNREGHTRGKIVLAVDDALAATKATR